MDLVPGATPLFHVEEGDEEDRSDLDTLIARISTWSWTGMRTVADLRFDSSSGSVRRGRRPNNHYLHSDANGRSTMLPWGTDQAFVRRLPYGDPGGVLFNRCLEDPACETLYELAVADVRERLGAVDLRGLRSGRRSSWPTWQRADPRREHSLPRIRGATAGLLRFIKVRPGDTTWLTAPAPATPPTG